MKTKAQQIAVEFSKLLRADFNEERMQEIISKNATPEYKDACASHDYCDANEVMAEAFEKITGKAVSIQNQADCKLWGKAWDISKETKFATE